MFFKQLDLWLHNKLMGLMRDILKYLNSTNLISKFIDFCVNSKSVGKNCTDATSVCSSEILVQTLSVFSNRNNDKDIILDSMLKFHAKRFL